MSVPVTHGRLTPPLLFACRSPTDGITTFAMHKRTRSRSGGREPAVASGTAPATTIPHTFGHGRRTRTRSGRREPAVFVGNARARMTPPGFAQRRRTRNKSGERKPAVARETYLERRYRSCSADCRPACWRTLLRSRCRNHGGLRLPLVSVAGEWESNRLSKRCFVNHGGLTRPRSCSRAFARRRNCDLCDAQTHTQQERRV